MLHAKHCSRTLFLEIIIFFFTLRPPCNEYFERVREFIKKIELSWSTASDAGVYSLLLRIECASLLQFNSSCLGWCYRCKVNFPKYYPSNSLNLSNNHRIKYTLNISNFCFIINQFCAVIFFWFCWKGWKGHIAK